MQTSRIQLIYGVLTLGLIVFAVEIFSFLLSSLTAGRWMTPQQVAILQRQAGQAENEAVELEAAEGEAEGDTPPPRHIGSEVIHPYLGFVIDAKFHRHLRFQDGGQDALDYGLSLNEPGLFREPSPDRPVIAVTGGSVAFNFAHAISGELREELAAALPGYERAVIVPLALPGYKQPQQLIALSYYLAMGAHFDVVINLDGFNEVALPLAENLRRGVNPLFPRNWYFRVQDFDPSTRLAIGKLAFLVDRRQRRAELFSKAPWRYSPTAGLLWTVLDRLAQREIAEHELALDRADQVAAGYTVTGPPWRFKDDAASYRQLALFWQRASEQMHDLATGRGIRYYHFLQPNQYLAGSKPMTEEERRIAIQTEGYPVGAHAAAAYPLLIEHGRQLVERGVLFKDLTQLFAGIEEPVYIDRCCHLNTFGKRQLIRAVAATIRQDLEQQRRTEEES